MVIDEIKQVVGTGTISSNGAGSSSKADITIVIGKDYE